MELLIRAKVGIDFMDFYSKKYLLCVDYYSKFIEITFLSNGYSSQDVQRQLKSMLAWHGIPCKLISDRETFSSKEFKSFLDKWDGCGTLSLKVMLS